MSTDNNEPATELQNNEMKEVFSNYLEQEKELEKRIRECETSNFEALRSSSAIKNPTPTSNANLRFKAAQERNQQLLKDLERAKALLRTESTFSPTEDELRQAAANYRRFLQK